MTEKVTVRQSASDSSKPGPDFFDRLELITEKYLTYRRRKRRIKKEKQRKKNVILDWIEAFLWAVGMVLLANQYLVQAYSIPTGSMIDTLLVGDRLFVNKIVYGPELLPGLVKLPSPIQPARNDVIIFQNPAYVSRGTVFDIAQRIIYMLTLSMVDIDRDEFGDPRAHFLIKRAVGVGGDRFIQERGNKRLRPAGENRWMDESEFNYLRGFTHNLGRLIDESAYPAIEAAGRASAFRTLGLDVPTRLQFSGPRAFMYDDPIARERARLEVLRGAHPHNARYSALLARHTQGIYVPEARILTLGDNRDNSKDGRHFGTVRSDRVLGRALIVYWPGNLRAVGFQALERFGRIR